MKIIQTKRVDIDGTAIELYSVDGRTWSSNLIDVQQFANRTAGELRVLVDCVETISANIARSERAAIRKWKKSVDHDRHRSWTFRVKDQGQIRDEP